mmetsp:Transcript_5755/g.6195  ORF Transcript_5755/g.6195 Transcript_5755/m.6195 type:complete len:134 (+) Transcript_5755:232-633(+)
MTKTTQEYSLVSKGIECNLIDDEDDEYANNIVCILNKVIIRMSNNDEMNGKKLNLKQKGKQKWKQQWQKSKYSRKMKIKNKIVIMITNITKEYTTSEEYVRRDNETKGILKMMHRRRLTKKKRVPNQWPDHPT